jgi:4'-phosphopantetheinyl transferase
MSWRGDSKKEATLHYVDVWTINDDYRAIDSPLTWSLLSDSEKRRALRFVHPEDRLTYIAGRSAIRQLTGRQLGTDPRAVRIISGIFGKPYVDTDELAGPFWFNISHSRGQVMIATATSTPVGIDVQWMGHNFDMQRIADRFFRKEESQYLLGLDEPQKTFAFYRMWVRKEAYLKAVGTGLRNGLHTAPIQLPETINDLRPEAEAVEFNRWSIIDTSANLGFFAAVCGHAPLRIGSVKQFNF